MIWRHIQLNLMLLFFPNITCDHFMIKKINFYGTPSSWKHDLHPQLPAYFFIFFYLQQLSPASELATNWWTEARVCWDERGEILRRRIPKETWGVGDGAGGFLNPSEPQRTKNAWEYLLPKSRNESRGRSFTIKLFPTASPTMFLLMGTLLGAVWEHN